MPSITSHPMFMKRTSSKSFSYTGLHFSINFNRVGNVVYCTGTMNIDKDFNLDSNNHVLVGSVPSDFKPFGSASIFFRCNYIFLSIESDGKIYLFTNSHFFEDFGGNSDDSRDSYLSGSWLTLGDHPYIAPKYDYFYNDYYNKSAKTTLSYKFSEHDDFIMKLDLSRVGRFVHLNGVYYNEYLYKPTLFSAKNLIPYGYHSFSPNHVPLVGCGVDTKYTCINKEGNLDASVSSHIDKMFSISGLWITTDYI